MEVGHLPAVSPDPVVFPSLDDISGRASYPMIKAHGKIKQLDKKFVAFHNSHILNRIVKFPNTLHYLTNTIL